MGKMKDKSIDKMNAVPMRSDCSHFEICGRTPIGCSTTCEHFNIGASAPRVQLSDEQLEQFGRHVGGIVHFSLGFNDPLKSEEIKKILQTAEDYLFYVNDLMLGG